ncbi:MULTISPECIES: hypothetical protein [Rhodanobacter]|uniref:Stress-induced protein n=1 Tax=Rhodanobacter hydrolyticus TaxID=2250595 RepID=A0ABW8JDE7_9GAMM|nr:hypothetical protein [Rhodanobacter sp. 7MK24]MBD8882320.1 hypothetical protein [Rhodanobacter sp. 7MK24]
MTHSHSNQNNERGGNHEQPIKAGQQNPKNEDRSSSAAKDSKNSGGSVRGGGQEQHMKSGQQSHKNDR